MIKEVNKGSILSENSFYVVERVEGNNVICRTDTGTEVCLSQAYVDQCTDLADSFSKEEKITKTALAELFINSPRVAMTVAFYKADKEKGKKVFEAEKAVAIQKIQEARVSDVPTLLNELIENPISRNISGELRVMKGRHHGSVDDLGRVHFIDMEQAKGDTAHDARMKQCDPRTIQYLIVGDVKYTLK